MFGLVSILFIIYIFIFRFFYCKCNYIILLKIQRYVANNEQAKEDGDKPGLEAMLQKVLQLYASNSLSKRSYAMKGWFIVHAPYTQNLCLNR